MSRVLCLLLLATACRLTTPPESESAPAGLASTSGSSSRPNIVFILTDDQDAASTAVMPNLNTLIRDQGITFSRFYYSLSLCCPSRTSMHRGQYPHNHQIHTNFWPNGGWKKVNAQGLESSMVATWLTAAGYRTSYIGKYLNEYNLAPTGYIPPGWADWHAVNSAQTYGTTAFNYTLNENGVTVAYGSAPANYSTDVFKAKALAFINAQASDTVPFFLWVSVYGLTHPAPRHASLFSTATLPATPNFNETDVSDKPQWVKNNPVMTSTDIANLTNNYRARLRALQSTDEMIAAIVNALASTGQLDNTYVIFASDNSYHLGEHRLARDNLSSYEEYIRGPLYVRGPGVPAGLVLDQPVLNQDMAPTFAAIAGATVPAFVDGRSLLPLFSGSPPPAWRQNFAVEMDLASPQTNPKRAPEFFALRTAQYTYVEYITGERELYDNLADPFQLQNRASTASPTLLSTLSAKLAAIRACVGVGCQSVEDTP